MLYKTDKTVEKTIFEDVLRLCFQIIEQINPDILSEQTHKLCEKFLPFYYNYISTEQPEEGQSEELLYLVNQLSETTEGKAIISQLSETTSIVPIAPNKSDNNSDKKTDDKNLKNTSLEDLKLKMQQDSKTNISQQGFTIKVN